MPDLPLPAALSDLVADRPWLLLLVIAAVVLLLRLLGRAGGGPVRRGQVWFAMVPFRDGTGAKDRPVVVLSVGRRTCEVARMTSQDRSARRDHARVPEVLPGLDAPSWADLRPVTLRRSALRRHLGDVDRSWLAWYREQSARL